MAKGINDCHFIGNLGRDTELRITTRGKVVNFSIAVSDTYKRDGETKEHVEWVNIVAYDGLAQLCDDLLMKGTSVYVKGRMQTRKWVDNDNGTRYTTEIIAREVRALAKLRPSDTSATEDRTDLPEGHPDDDDAPF